MAGKDLFAFAAIQPTDLSAPTNRSATLWAFTQGGQPPWDLNARGWVGVIATTVVDDGIAEASLIATLDDVTLSSTAKAIAKATLSVTLADVTSSSTAKAPAHAIIGITLDDVTASATARAEAHAVVGATLDDITLTATAKSIAKASLDVTLDDVTLQSEATSVAPPAGAAGLTLLLLKRAARLHRATFSMSATLDDVTLDATIETRPVVRGAEPSPASIEIVHPKLAKKTTRRRIRFIEVEPPPPPKPVSVASVNVTLDDVSCSSTIVPYRPRAFGTDRSREDTRDDDRMRAVDALRRRAA